MVQEIVQYLNCSPDKTYVDGTLGGGGHARAILEAIGSQGFLLGIDRDQEAIVHAGKSLRQFKPNFRLFHNNFTDLPAILSEVRTTGVDGILLDLGVSLHQLEGSGRGFSFMRDEPLDMRMNTEEGVTAESLVNTLPERDLASLIARYGEERYASRIAKRIVASRRQEKIRSSLQLADIVKRAIPAERRRGRIHPATRTFQAIRIAVNRELDCLERFLDVATECLKPGGRLCIVSFHSLEDRIVKNKFKTLARGCTCPPDFPRCVCGKPPQISILTKRPVRAGDEEIKANPMARSAKLRAAERLGEEGA
jgi:16S rRNA (cytosine1402-N4)-methyltransferase